MKEEIKRLVTRRDLETEDIDLVALRKALRAERMASANVFSVKDTDHMVIDLQTKKRRVA